MNKLTALKKEIRAHANPAQAQNLARFFKTKKGEYGYGDVFLGLTVPTSRKIAKSFRDLDIKDIEILLHSKIHEERFIALVLLTHKMEDPKLQKQVYAAYLKNTRSINNWDLVDVSAPRVVGRFLMDKPRSVLKKLARSQNLWERRIAIVSTLYFIVNNEFDDTMRISRMLLRDEHDLIHKATGWMLREVGKRSVSALKNFLDEHAPEMPRTMLRYAIEKYTPEQRRLYMQRKKFQQ